MEELVCVGVCHVGRSQSYAELAHICICFVGTCMCIWCLVFIFYFLLFAHVCEEPMEQREQRCSREGPGETLSGGDDGRNQQ